MGSKKFVVVYNLKTILQGANGYIVTDEYDLNDIKKEIEEKKNQKISIAHEKIERKDNQVFLILTFVVRG
jgi:hypothetical protein